MRIVSFTLRWQNRNNRKSKSNRLYPSLFINDYLRNKRLLTYDMICEVIKESKALILCVTVCYKLQSQFICSGGNGVK